MGAHINAEGKFQSDKYPSCPAGKVPLSTTDRTAQDLLWEYAQRRRSVDAEFSADLEAALLTAGYTRPKRWRHLKRGSTYIEVARGQIQSQERPLDGEPVVIYRSETDGAVWARPSCEFEDGRFEPAE